MAASQLYVPGPSYLAVGTGANFAPEFLGVGDEQGARVVLNGRYEDVLTDLSGPAVPFDVQYFAEDCFVSITLTRVQASVLTKVQARMQSRTGGTIQSADVGTLMRLEQFSMPLWVKMPYVAKAAFSDTMIAGFHFHCAYPVDALERHVSTRVERPRVTFRCIPDWATDGSALLYDHDMSAFPALT